MGRVHLDGAALTLKALAVVESVKRFPRVRRLASERLVTAANAILRLDLRDPIRDREGRRPWERREGKI